ncbi:hypothetical protein Hamer_G023859 [Homarus americanus]|uniref:RNase H type-1 domain-containing protein n=1 Tax=Homarus americanus TaxID=6706 RepID=A0A8J5MLA7_HOMAM|nr:hypothetical protein Hamer_G023859 [Homarus americanus]
MSLGFKISIPKSKAMMIGHNEPVTQLQIQGIALQWVNVYKYLGIWIDKGLKFDNEINYLRDRMADAVNRLKLKDTILSKGPDTMSPDYSTPAPWESPPAVINILQTGTRKAGCNPHELRQVAERNMKALTPHNSTVYYTDGSVETTSTKAGAAFTIEGGNTSLWRTSDGCSTLQVELAAILGALRHASINSQQGIQMRHATKVVADSPAGCMTTPAKKSNNVIMNSGWRSSV